MLVLVVRMYIFTEREKEANPIRTRSRASLLTDIYCAQKCVRAAINLRIHTEFLIYIFSAECFSLFLSFSLSFSFSHFSFLRGFLPVPFSHCCIPSSPSTRGALFSYDALLEFSAFPVWMTPALTDYYITSNKRLAC